MILYLTAAKIIKKAACMVFLPTNDFTGEKLAENVTK
jgi:hypothetical protein